MASSKQPQAVIVGAGAAGLWAAAELRRRDVGAVVLERSGSVGTSWRRRYDGLRLNTVRWLSGLPGTPIPRQAGAWPTREDFVTHLELVATRHELDVRFGVDVSRIDRAGERWRLQTSAGPFEARFVIVATGYDRVPAIPPWPGRERFAGELIHARDYVSARDFAGRDVLVVGSGNTGTEIATQLVNAGASAVRLSMRTPVNIVPRRFLGVPMTLFARLGESGRTSVGDRFGSLVQRLAWGDLTRYGMPRAPYGISTELQVKGLGPVMDGGFVRALKERRIELVPAVESLDREQVLLSGGGRIRPEVVIAATGYRHGLENLVGHLGVLHRSGKPLVLGERTHPDAPRLYFNGFWLPASGQLPAMRRTSRRIARAVARERRRARQRE